MIRLPDFTIPTRLRGLFAGVCDVEGTDSLIGAALDDWQVRKEL
jgi:hypothetical protein